MRNHTDSLVQDLRNRYEENAAQIKGAMSITNGKFNVNFYSNLLTVFDYFFAIQRHPYAFF